MNTSYGWALCLNDNGMAFWFDECFKGHFLEIMKEETFGNI